MIFVTKLLHFGPKVSRTLLFALSLSAMAGCGEDHEPSYMSDEAWLEMSQATPVGAVITAQEEGSGTRRRMRTLGFVRDGEKTWRRAARLDIAQAAKPLGGFTLKNIDSVSVMSIDRHNGEEPYIYGTLQSLFSELPPDSTVNVYVGDDDADYVSFPVLTEKIGAVWAQQVHVIGTPTEVAEHFRKYKFSVKEKSTWNYGRILRAHKGSAYLLITEDDVSWARRSVAFLDRLLDSASPQVISAYNWRCGKLPGGSHSPASDIKILSLPLHWYHKKFSGTQAMLFSAQHSKSIGNHLLMHAGRKPYDLELDAFMRARDLHIGVAQPSMVQHEGVKTTGLGYHHTSRCFRPIFPAVE